MTYKKSIFKCLFFLNILIFLCCISYIKTLAANKKIWNDEVKSEEQMPNKSWFIKFTVPIDKTTINENTIYVLDTDGSRKSDIVLQITDNSVRVVPVTEYKQGHTYTLYIGDGIKSKDGKELNPLYKVEFKIKKVDSDFFRIRDIESVSRNIVNLYFTHPINMNVELPTSYEILEEGQPFVKGSYTTLQVKCLPGTKNGIIVFLKDRSFVQGKKYTLKVNGNIASIYGVNLKEGNGDQIDFIGTDANIPAIGVDRVYAINQNTIRVEFNLPIDKESVEDIENYKLIDSSSVPKDVLKAAILVDGIYAGRGVDLKVSGTFDSKRSYSLTIKSIYDLYKKEAVSSGPYEFAALDLENMDLKIVNTAVIDKGTIDLYFNKAVDPTQASNIVNYVVSGITESFSANPVKVLYQADQPYMVRLYLPLSNSLSGGSKYGVTVSPYVNPDFALGSYNQSEATFYCNSNDVDKPSIYEAKIISSNAIKICFTREVSTMGINAIPSNYILEYKDGSSSKTLTPSSITFVDPITAVLKFNKLDFSNKYILRFSQLQDYSEQYMTISESGLNSISVTISD